MNKKAAALPMEKLIGIIILVVFLAVVAGAFFRPEKGWLNAIADKAESFARFIPGRDEVSHVSGLEVDSDIQKSYDSIYEKFIELRDIEQTQCWAEYDKIPELNSITINIEKKENDFIMYIISEKGQKLESDLVEDLKPCIVAGKAKNGGTVAVYFYRYYINPGYKAPSLLPYMYSEVSSITIKEDGGISEDEDMKADGEEYNLEAYKYLYKHDSEHICFMPVHDSWWSCKGALKGLRYHCFQGGIMQRNVPKCNLK